MHMHTLNTTDHRALCGTVLNVFLSAYSIQKGKRMFPVSFHTSVVHNKSRQHNTNTSLNCVPWKAFVNTSRGEALYLPWPDTWRRADDNNAVALCLYLGLEQRAESSLGARGQRVPDIP
jgi:hypothetical protein